MADRYVRRLVTIAALVAAAGAMAPLTARGAMIPTLYASTTAGVLEKFTAANTPTVIASGLTTPVAGVAVDLAGDVYVASGNAILKFDPNGVQSPFVSWGLSMPHGLALDAKGNLYVANGALNMIMRYTPAGVGSVFANTDLKNPTGIAFDSAGDLYVSNQTTGDTIVEFNSAGAKISAITTNIGGASGIAVDVGGDVLLVNLAGNAVVKFPPGGVSSVLPISGLGDPAGIVLDSGGDVFVANHNFGRIAEYSAAGVQSTFASGVTGVQSLAFAVPEPSAILLMLPAMLAIGASRARRA